MLDILDKAVAVDGGGDYENVVALLDVEKDKCLGRERREKPHRQKSQQEKEGVRINLDIKMTFQFGDFCPVLFDVWTKSLKFVRYCSFSKNWGDPEL